MHFFRLLTLIGMTIMLCSCADKLDSYKGTTPVMKFDEFFNGPVKGYGIVQDRGGKIINRFDIDMVGTWKGNDGTLAEHFVYYDGHTQDRTWKIKKLSDNTFVGHADDIIGDAPGRSEGTAIRWNYVMQVPVGGRTFNLAFDDWMFMMNDGIVINRSVMKKFGIRVADLTIVMRKQTK